MIALFSIFARSVVSLFAFDGTVVPMEALFGRWEKEV